MYQPVRNKMKSMSPLLMTMVFLATVTLAFTLIAVKDHSRRFQSATNLTEIVQ